jgi:methionyl-tRNA formyltransferase
VISIVFFGTPDFAVPTLEALTNLPGAQVRAVITQPDRPAGRGGELTAPPVKRCAVSKGIPVYQPHSLRKEFTTLQSSLQNVGPFDLGVVVAFGQILPAEVLNWPRCGCVNIHASLLPRWRGAAPIQRAIEAGDPETGVCLMQMDVGLDTGAVFATARTPITADDTTPSLHDRLAMLGSQLLVDQLAGIVSGSLTAHPQPNEGVSYAKKITSEECLVSWSSSARELALKIRAFTPHPGCFTTWQERRFKLLLAHETQPLPSDVQNASPGVVVRSSPETLVVKCGEGLLSLDQVQLEGKKRMSINEFLRGSQIPAGTTL